MNRHRLICFVAFVVMAVALLGLSVAMGAEKITLRLSSWQWTAPGFGDFWEATTKEFMDKHPNIRIKKYYLPYAELWDKLNVEIVAGTPPDILELTGFNLFQYIPMGALEPLDDYLIGTDIQEKTRWQKTFPVVDGKTWVVNLSARTMQLMCNMKLFNEKGLKPPTTMEEFKDVAVKLTDPAKNQYGAVLVNVDHPRMYEYLLVWVAGLGGHFAKDGHPTLDDPITIKGVEFFKKILDAGAMPIGVKDHAVQWSWFNDGKAAMTIDGAWWFPAAEKQVPELVPHVKVFPEPTPTHAATGGVNNVIGISSKTKYKNEVWEYIKFISTDEWAKKWVYETRTLNCRKGSVTDDFLEKNPYFKVYAKEIDHAIPLPAPGMEEYFDVLSRIINRHVAEALYENKPMAEVLKAAQKEAEELIK